jgi:hypothetical protein
VGHDAGPPAAARDGGGRCWTRPPSARAEGMGTAVGEGGRRACGVEVSGRGPLGRDPAARMAGRWREGDRGGWGYGRWWFVGG